MCGVWLFLAIFVGLAYLDRSLSVSARRRMILQAARSSMMKQYKACLQRGDYDSARKTLYEMEKLK